MEEVKIKYIDVYYTEFDEQDYEIPQGYEVILSFFNHDYRLIFTRHDLDTFDEYGILSCSDIEGNLILCNSVENYFSNSEEESSKLIEEFKNIWNNWSTEKNKIYDFKGNKIN